MYEGRRSWRWQQRGVCGRHEQHIDVFGVHGAEVQRLSGDEDGREGPHCAGRALHQRLAAEGPLELFMWLSLSQVQLRAVQNTQLQERPAGLERQQLVGANGRRGDLALSRHPVDRRGPGEDRAYVDDKPHDLHGG